MGKEKLTTTLYIANRAFSDSRKFNAIYKHHQIVDLRIKYLLSMVFLSFGWLFRMNKIKTCLPNRQAKYNALAQCIRQLADIAIYCPTCHTQNVMFN